jgi:hypothetical protein
MAAMRRVLVGESDPAYQDFLTWIRMWVACR